MKPMLENSAMDISKTITMILLQVPFILGGFACAGSDSNQENMDMEQQVYTLGVWHVREGQQKDFIVAWKELGEIFASLPHPPGKGTLIQSDSDPALFYSFGPWNSSEDIEAMRNDHRAQEGIRKLIDLCVEATPGSFHVVAESP
jgi:hypothetical protein